MQVHGSVPQLLRQQFVGLAGEARPIGCRLGGRRWAAVNVNPSEVDPTRVSEAEFGAAITRLPDTARIEGQIGERQREERQHIWQYLLAAMLAIMAVESLVGMRAT